MNKININKLISIILILVVIVCSLKLFYKDFSHYKDRKNYSEFKEIKQAATVTPPKKTDKMEDSKENKLKAINSDYKLWINIPNTDIDYPVVQGKDNDFYLHKNFNKQKSESGTIFIDYRNDMNLDTEKNIVFYGHHMKDGTMFNQINKYKNVENIKSGIIKIVKDDKEYMYEIFSVFVLDEKKDNLKIKFTSTKDYANYIQFLKEKSIYKKVIEGNDYNNIITLYTCSYEFTNAKTIVCAVLK
ncbi:MAG: class B sortase [Clostridium sp.]|uniref:class B sortase n=1 Tax=Clostridium sp. TaxID=1506 RepID=UPI003D6C7A0C